MSGSVQALRHKPWKVLISGNSGTGKSTFATACLLGSPHPIKFIFDQEGEISLRTDFAPAYDAEGLLEQMEHGWCIFDPNENFEDMGEAFSWFCHWVFEVKKAINRQAVDEGRPIPPALFFVDELQNLIETHTVPIGFRSILERGRRRGIDTLLVTQQPNIIHNRARNQITEVVAFSQVDEIACEFLEKLGFDGEDIRALPEGAWRLLSIRRRLFQWGRVVWRPDRVVIDGSKVFSSVADSSSVPAQLAA